MENVLALFSNLYIVIGLATVSLFVSIILSEKTRCEWTSIFLAMPFLFVILFAGQDNPMEGKSKLFYYITENYFWLKLIIIFVIMLSLSTLSFVQGNAKDDSPRIIREITFSVAVTMIVSLGSLLMLRHFILLSASFDLYKLLYVLIFFFLTMLTFGINILLHAVLMEGNGMVIKNSLWKQVKIAIIIITLIAILGMF